MDFDDFTNAERLSFMTPFNNARLVNAEMLGSKFAAEVGVFLLECDVDAVAVGAMAADGGNAQNAVHEDGVGVGKYPRSERRGVPAQSEVLFGSGYGGEAV